MSNLVEFRIGGRVCLGQGFTCTIGREENVGKEGQAISSARTNRETNGPKESRPAHHSERREGGLEGVAQCGRREACDYLGRSRQCFDTTDDDFLAPVEPLSRIQDKRWRGSQGQ